MNLGPIGIQEIIIVLLVILLLFGPRRLPKIAKDVAKSLQDMRRGVREFKNDIDITKLDD